MHAHHSKDHALFHSDRFHMELMPLDEWVSRLDYDILSLLLEDYNFLYPRQQRNSFLFFRDYEQTSSLSSSLLAMLVNIQY